MKQYSLGKIFFSLKITDYKISRQQQGAFSLCTESEFPLEWSRKNELFTIIYVTNCLYSSTKNSEEEVQEF